MYVQWQWKTNYIKYKLYFNHVHPIVILISTIGYGVPHFGRDTSMIFHRCQWKWQTRFALLQEMSLLSLASFCQSKAALYRLFFNCIIQEDYVKWRGPLFFRFVSVIVDEVDTVRDFGKMPTSCIEPLCYDQHLEYRNKFLQIFPPPPHAQLDVHSHMRSKIPNSSHYFPNILEYYWIFWKSILYFEILFDILLYSRKFGKWGILVRCQVVLLNLYVMITV